MTRQTRHTPARRRLAGLCLIAATALTVALPVRAVAATGADTTSSAVVPVDWADGWNDQGWNDQAWNDQAWGGGGPDREQTATVDSDPATDAESAGVVLIDTVVSGGRAAGTGMVLTAKGQVLTNYHVVEGATTINVTVATTGKTYAATVLGSDQSADVALLQLKDASGLDPVTIDDDSVAVGDTVTAVGNAGGTGSLTAAEGTVTALKASITTASEGSVEGETLTSMIETDADVVAGDWAVPCSTTRARWSGSTRRPPPVPRSTATRSRSPRHWRSSSRSGPVTRPAACGSAPRAIWACSSPTTRTATWALARVLAPRALRSPVWSTARPRRRQGWKPATSSPRWTAVPSPRPRTWRRPSPTTTRATP